MSARSSGRACSPCCRVVADALGAGGGEEAQIEDLIGPLVDEILAVVLVMPDVSVATLQPPTPSPRARQLAAEIPDDANAYHRALKAIAQRRFGDARPLLALAMRNDDAQPLQIRLARALTEMYAGQYGDAAQWYGEVLMDEPDNPTFLCQLSVAWMQAYQFGKAEPLLYQAARVCLEMPPEERDPLLSVCYHLQGVLCIGQGKGYQEAETKCTQAHDLFQKTRGQQHVFVAASLCNHATLYMLQAKYPGAQGLVQRAHSIWSRALGPNDPHLLASLGNLAMLHCAR